MTRVTGNSKISAKARNLVPRDLKHVLTVVLTDQDKFNLVIEKLIEKIDKLDEQRPEKIMKAKTTT